jgi:flagellar biosynthesis/type III secretory pathway chaperone
MAELAIINEGHEIDKKDDWERSRMSSIITILPHMKKGANIDPKSIFPLPWDEVKKLDIANFAENVTKFKEAIKRVQEKNIANGRLSSRNQRKNRRL